MIHNPSTSPYLEGERYKCMNINSFFVIAHNIRSLYNVGSIFRTADALEVNKIFLTGYTGTPKNPRLAPYINFDSPSGSMRQRWAMQKMGHGLYNNPSLSLGQKEEQCQSSITGLAKTSLGAEKTVPWEYYKYLPKALKKLKNEKVHIVALENNVTGTIPLNKFRPKFPLALLLGEELKGINKKYLKFCDAIVEIPQTGKKESLNVSVAFGIAAYSISSKRKWK